MSSPGPQHADPRASTLRGLLRAIKKVSSLNAFNNFGLAEPILRALIEEKYEAPTPIQVGTIPVALSGRDVIGIAQTGTSKTAGFALPILHRLSAAPRALAGAQPHARTLWSNPRCVPGLWPSSSHQLGARDWRRADRPAGARAVGRRRRAGCNARAVDRPRARQCAASRRCRSSRARRSRPNARYGLHPRHPHNRSQASTPTADAVLLGDHAARDRGTCQSDAECPVKVAVTPLASTVERVEKRIIHLNRADKAIMLADPLEARADRTCARVHPHQARRRQSCARPRQGRDRRGSDPRQ